MVKCRGCIVRGKSWIPGRWLLLNIFTTIPLQHTQHPSHPALAIICHNIDHLAGKATMVATTTALTGPHTHSYHHSYEFYLGDALLSKPLTSTLLKHTQHPYYTNLAIICYNMDCVAGSITIVCPPQQP